MNASYAVDDLGHVHIQGDACKHVRPVVSAGRTKQSNRFMAYQTNRIVPMDKKYDRCQRFLAAVQDFRS